MHRLLIAALATSLLISGPAQGQEKPAADKPAAKPGDADARIQEAVQRAVAKAKEELREEMRVEAQNQQTAAAFLAPAEEKAKLDFLQLNGYLRFRGDLFDSLDLRRFPAGSIAGALFPVPIIGSAQTEPAGTITSANMRFRLEPTLNVSEQVRIRAQIDMLDNLVLGSTPELSTFTPTRFDSQGQLPPEAGVNSDRPSIAVKRAWGEVQTPLGLLSFGRMPNAWGMGILANAGRGIDDDFGDTVDRLQFAIPVGQTPLGRLTIIPMLDFVAGGVTTAALGQNRGLGQPFDTDQGDDARALGVKILRLDGEDELKRKLDKGIASFNFGLWYSHKTQTFDFPSWRVGSTPAPGDVVRRDAFAHVFDLWARLETPLLHLEGELAGIYGEIGNAAASAGPVVGPVLLRQLGGAVNAAAKLSRGKVRLGGEIGMASGDRDPGFGYFPGVDPQYAAGDRVLDVRNFRFNRAYRVDNILFRELIGGVTDAWYVKPTLRWEFLEGLAASAQILYAAAMYATSTPSYNPLAPGAAHAALGVEGDLGLSYASDDGFFAWLNYGIFFPMDGFNYPIGTTGHSISRAHALRAGLAVRF